MASVIDVAQYILERHGPMTTMKLQKLVYYAQAWSIVWDDDVLFDDPIQAWKAGPVVRTLYERHRGHFRIATIGGTAANLSERQRDTIDRVLRFYGDKSAQWLSDLTHMEDPWKYAYGRAENTEITPEALAEYYGSLLESAHGEQEGSANSAKAREGI
jgi:uncharacterized phage-associated protein